MSQAEQAIVLQLRKQQSRLNIPDLKPSKAIIPKIVREYDNQLLKRYNLHTSERDQETALLRDYLHNHSDFRLTTLPVIEAFHDYYRKSANPTQLDEHIPGYQYIPSSAYPI